MINTQALIGTMLGTCSLQKLIGRGGMGAVFLAHQSRPQRRVAVKVLLPETSLTPNQWPAFLERFRKERDVLGSLKHQNILPVYEYGEQDGLAYLVMPYIGAGTLVQILERSAPLALPEIVTYLEQMGAALDYVHERGILHQNIKPANVLLTAQGSLLLSDSGLTKLVAEKEALKVRLMKSGAPGKVLKYMAPEQVMGDVVSVHTDLYSLGVILYQMVTGKLPFQEETAVQMARQLVQASPPSPRQLRPGLPVAAEQVILRAMAKRPADRYARAQDLARAFRVALTAASIPLDGLGSQAPICETSTSNPSFAPRRGSLFDPVWQKSKEETPLVVNEQRGKESTATLPTERNTPFPPMRPRLGPKTGFLRPMDGAKVSPADATNGNAAAPMPVGERSFFPGVPSTATSPFADPVSPFPATSVTGTLSTPQSDHGHPSTTREVSTTKRAIANPLSPFPTMSATGALMAASGEESKPGTIKLTGAVKVVQVPIAGQPGRYVTGLLPVSSPAPSTQEEEEPLLIAKAAAKWKDIKKQQKIVALAVFMILVLIGSTLLLFHAPGQTSKNGIQAEHIKPNLQAITAARATATAAANTILIDPLHQNIHNWPVVTTGYRIYVFKDGAYHIIDNDANKSAPAILSNLIVKGSMAYSLTMEEIRGDDSSVNNSFGMILRFNSQTQGGRDIVTFYSFEVVNNASGEYQFWKYDNSKDSSPWTSIWQQPFGSEFHQGQGPKSINTLKVFVSGKYFTFTVNGQKVGTAADSSLSGGEVGMLVNLKGTEVAFSDLRLTYS